MDVRHGTETGTRGTIDSPDTVLRQVQTLVDRDRSSGGMTCS